MQAFDPAYLGRALSGLSGVPIRIYRGGEETGRYFPVSLPRDPMELHRAGILAVSEHVGYFVTPLFHYYGILNAGELKIVAGPTAQIMADEPKMRDLAFRLDVPREEVPAFLTGMAAIRRLPVETLLQMLCAVNHFLNGGETLEISDLAIHEAEQALLKTDLERERAGRRYEGAEPEQRPHNTLAVEEVLMEIVRKGDTAALRSWLTRAPAVRGGTIAKDQLRQLRNTFIVSATLASRAAIRGGMREDDAFSLSDAYIQKVELLSDYGRIMNLQLHMLTEFTEQVEQLRHGERGTGLVREAADYVRRHLSEPVSVEAMASALYLSRPYLSARFRKETGQTLTDFILNEKTEEAKRLLRYSDKSVSAIGSYLGFSSSAHFSRVFRKYAGCAPREYREQLT